MARHISHQLPRSMHITPTALCVAATHQLLAARKYAHKHRLQRGLWLHVLTAPRCSAANPGSTSAEQGQYQRLARPVLSCSR
jgi:hypothetical protein